MISSITRLRIFGVSLLLAVTMLPATVFAQTRPSIAALQAANTALQTRVSVLEANNVPGLASYLAVDTSTPTRPVVRVTAANFQVVNGTGSTFGTVNGVGNLLVGYDESNLGGVPAVCSLGQYADQTSCTGAGGTWGIVHKTGSHNIVVGPYNRYSRYGGLIVGYGNTINGVYASVSAGQYNTASGPLAGVSGGYQNTASGGAASVSGGSGNIASSTYASVSGGLSNTASDNYASVSGGETNVANGIYSSVSGGHLNRASGEAASVSGGEIVQALGPFTSMSGGHLMGWTIPYTWAGGDLHSP